jgi:hypothetical protein
LIVTMSVAGLLVALCCYVHWAALCRLRRIVERPRRIRKPLLLIVLILFLVHLFQVTLYALAMSALDAAGYGRLVGAVIGGSGWFEDHFHFSIASYTTLGIGDIMAEGPIRIVAGIEALNGLVLVAWSASFTYLAMERLWAPEPPGSASN